MADLENEQKFEIELDLSGIPEDKWEDVKSEVGGFVVSSVLEYVGSGKSPVSGEKDFPRLNKKYAERVHDGNTLARLEDKGDLLSALAFEPSDNGVIVGIFDESQQPKADGHNNLSGDSRLPKRRFIPSSSQKYKSEIMSGIKDILDSYKSESGGIGSLSESLSNEGIAELLAERLRI